MRTGIRQSMAWLHTWAGLLAGWLLFAIFVCGTLSYYRTSITSWMEPERLLTVPSASASASATATATAAAAAASTVPTTSRSGQPQDFQVGAAERAFALLNQRAPLADRWVVTLPGGPVLAGSVSWQDGARGTSDQSGAKRRRDSHTMVLPGPNGLTPRDTQGGDFIYNFHYQLYHLPIVVGRWIIGAAAMFMLVAIISGIFTHRRIFVDLFTFRPRKGQRSWLDAHNVSGVLALPYHLMITYTGLATLMLSLMPWGLQAHYSSPGGMLAFYSDAYDFTFPGKASGVNTPLPAIAPLVRDAVGRFNHDGAKESEGPNAHVNRAGRFDGAQASSIWVDNPGDAQARIKIMRGNERRLSVAPESVTYDVHGNVIAEHLHNAPAVTTAGVMYGLHEAYFVPQPLRIVFFLSGLAGALMVASGLVIWTGKHRQKRFAHRRSPGWGLLIVETLNLAVIGGLPLAIAGYFYANRLIPADIAGRSADEVQAFFIVWGGAALHAALHAARQTGRRGWIVQYVLSGTAFALLPLVDRLTMGQWVMPGFDFALWGGALLCGAIVWYLTRHRSPARGRSGSAGGADNRDNAGNAGKRQPANAA